MATRKISLSLESQLVDDLDYVSRRLSISRSALVSQLLSEAIPPTRKIMEKVPESPTALDVVRLRGESAGIVAERMEQLHRITNDLFSKE